MGEQIYGIPHQVGRCIGQVVGSTDGVGNILYDIGIGIVASLTYQVWQVSMVYQHGREQGIIAPPLHQVLHVHTILLSLVWRHHITYYYIQLLVGNTNTGCTDYSRYQQEYTIQIIALPSQHYIYTSHTSYLLLGSIYYYIPLSTYIQYYTTPIHMLLLHTTYTYTSYLLAILYYLYPIPPITMLLLGRSILVLLMLSIGIWYQVLCYLSLLPTIYHTLHYICIHVM